MPCDAQFLSVQTQNERPYFCALVETENMNIVHQFTLVATGTSAAHVKASQLIGTFQIHQVTFHVFDLGI